MLHAVGYFQRVLIAVLFFLPSQLVNYKPKLRFSIVYKYVYSFIMNFEYVILPRDAISSDGIYNATVWQLNEENITKTQGCIHYLLMNLL